MNFGLRNLTFNNLEVVERSKIDTIKNGANVTSRQRLLITGFDSGLFKIPAFVFPVVPAGGGTPEALPQILTEGTVLAILSRG